MDLDIIYEDNDIIVCRKPAGLATQTKRLGQKDMESCLRNYRARKKEEPYIGLVHRLDQPVEGVMVFAKNPKAAASLSKQISSRTIGKHYWAIVWVDEKDIPEEGCLEDEIVTDKKTNVSYVAEKGGKDAKHAKLEYRVRTKVDGKAMVDITLHTGRQHQIRLQFSSRGWPLLGDSKYGRADDFRKIALCSYRLEFNHPSTGQPLTYEIGWNVADFIPLEYENEE